MRHWPTGVKLTGDNLICNIALPGNTPAGLTLLNRDPRQMEYKPDCYEGDVLEVGPRCKLVKVGDKVVFTRWEYSQSNVDDEKISLREMDLVIVNGRCVNGYAAVKLYEPFKKTNGLIVIDEKYAVPKSFWGQIIDLDHSAKNPDTKELREGNIIFFQHMSDYQYRVGQHTLVFKNIYDVPLAVMEEEMVNGNGTH